MTFTLNELLLILFLWDLFSWGVLRNLFMKCKLPIMALGRWDEAVFYGIYLKRVKTSAGKWTPFAFIGSGAIMRIEDKYKAAMIDAVAGVATAYTNHLKTINPPMLVGVGVPHQPLEVIQKGFCQKHSIIYRSYLTETWKENFMDCYEEPSHEQEK